jgi:hypothetical protein
MSTVCRELWSRRVRIQHAKVVGRAARFDLQVSRLFKAGECEIRAWSADGSGATLQQLAATDELQQMRAAEPGSDTLPVSAATQALMEAFSER